VGCCNLRSQSDSDVAEEDALLNSNHQRRNSHSGMVHSSLLHRPREQLQSIVMSMSVCGSVCPCDLCQILLCMLPMSVALASSDMFTIGRITYHWEGVFFPIENAYTCTLCSEKKHPLLFSFITSSQINQFAQKFQHL